jgi:hypothetical protein
VKVTVLIKEKSKHYEGLRSCLGLLLEDFKVNMIIIGDEIQMDEAYKENLEILKEFEGCFFSNYTANVKKYGFQYTDIEEISEIIDKSEKVIPF